jgi:hypothetical protein
VILWVNGSLHSPRAAPFLIFSLLSSQEKHQFLLMWNQGKNSTLVLLTLWAGQFCVGRLSTFIVGHFTVFWPQPIGFQCYPLPQTHHVCRHCSFSSREQTGWWLRTTAPRNEEQRLIFPHRPPFWGEHGFSAAWDRGASCPLQLSLVQSGGKQMGTSTACLNISCGNDGWSGMVAEESPGGNCP